MGRPEGRTRERKKAVRLVVDDLPFVWDDERGHVFGAECWCDPEVEVSGKIVYVRHRAEVG